MNKNTIIYHRSHTPFSLLGVKTPVWFAFDSSYGSESSYGSYLSTYRCVKKLKLLDLGKHATRHFIKEQIIKNDIFFTESQKQSFLTNFHPDWQWSGGKSNKEVHKVLQQLFCKKYDGTIIDSTAEDDLLGAEEIVLWPPFGKKVKKI